MTRLSWAGFAVFCAYAWNTIASCWLGPAQVLIEQSDEQALFYPSLTGLSVPEFLLHNRYFLPLYCGPILLATGVCAVVMLRIISGSGWSDATPRKLFGWSIAFAAVSLPALPVMAQDFWISAAWGKMVVQGMNPYHSDIPQPIALAWYPDGFLLRASYGPLWIAISGIVMSLTDSRWGAFVLFKLVLGAFWLTTLCLTRRLTGHRDVQTQCLALIMVGWLPLGVGQSVAEGHNDIAMATMVLVWIYSRNSIALMAAATMKYLAAPLLFLALVERRWLAELMAAALLGIVIFVVFFRGPAFFDGNKLMQDWYFMSPRDALAPLGQWAWLGRLPFLLLAAQAVWHYRQKPGDEARMQAIIAILAAVLFGMLPHIWPWYIVLVLVPAAALPFWRMSIWLTGLALYAPFSMIYHLRGLPRDWLSPWPSLILYLCAFGWLAIVELAARRGQYANVGDVGGAVQLQGLGER